MATKVNLDEIKNIPEDEFKQNLFEWVEQMDISKELQSKLRSDLFQNFGKTALGRQIAAQYQQSQRMVLSPMVLVINTLVAEFLYEQNCHFTLSVFTSEVPYKNVLPDFEKMNKFRFDSLELEEIMKALALDHCDAQKSEIVETYTTNREGSPVNKSLLFCIIKALIQSPTVPSNIPAQQEANLPPQLSPTKSLEDESICHHCKNNRKRAMNDELHSKYYKHFYKYLELLTQNVVEISENTKKLKEPSIKTDDQPSKGSLKTCQLSKRLDKITESLTNLSKSNRKARKVTEIVKTITRLTKEIQRCSDNVAKYSNAITQSSQETAKANAMPTTNYTEWLNRLTASTFGQKFIKNLEIAQEKAVAGEVQRMKEYFNEKFHTTRKLIKFHYKQKTFEKFRATMMNSPAMQSRRDDFNELIEEKLRFLKEKENYWKQRASAQMTSNGEPVIQMDVRNNNDTGQPTVPMKSSVIPNSSSNVVAGVPPSTKPKTIKSINIEVFNEPLRPIEPVIDNMVLVAKNRLQELEIESEQLDKSFQRYLRKQNQRKQVLADDIDKVWKQYEVAKDNMLKTFVVPERKNIPTDTTSVNFLSNPQATMPLSTDQLTTLPPMLSEFNEPQNPYKILHSNLTTTGTLDTPPQRKKEVSISAVIGSASTSTQPIENQTVASVDKVSQIPLPMKIKSIMKQPTESESKIHLRVSTGHTLSDAASPVHLSESKPSETSVQSNSAESIRSEKFRNGVRKPLVERSKAVDDNRPVVAENLTKQQDSAAVGVDAKDIPALFRAMEIQRKQSTHSAPTSGEDSSGERQVISTGHKSTSSDDFWK